MKYCLSPIFRGEKLNLREFQRLAYMLVDGKAGMLILLVPMSVLFPLAAHRAHVGMTFVFYTLPSLVAVYVKCLKYLRSKSVILSVPMASIFFFFFFKKTPKSSTCLSTKIQIIKVCYKVKKKISLPISPLPLSRGGDSYRFYTDGVQVFNFSP